MVPVLPRHLPEEKRRQYTDLVADGEVIDPASGEVTARTMPVTRVIVREVGS